MAIRINSVFQYKGENRYRILWSHGNKSHLVGIDIDASDAQPELIERAELIERITTHTAWLIEDPYAKTFLAAAQLTPAEHAGLDRAWAVMRAVLDQTPDIFDRVRRGRLLREAAKESGYSLPTLRKWLRRALQRGLTPYSLIPDYRRCGAKGQARLPDAEDGKPASKLGRPRRRLRGMGITVTKPIRQMMRCAWARFSDEVKKRAFARAYYWLLETYFTDDVEVVRTERSTKVEIRNHDAVPTLDQFYYHYDLEHSFAERKLARLGTRAFEKMFRPLLDNSLREVRGSGGRYHFDATILNCYVVSRFDTNFLVGRPTLYLVVDVFSRMVVGFHIGLESPSWVAAMMALINAAEDKVEFCRRHGVDMEPDDWPCAELPLHLLCDRGEMESPQATALAEAFGIDVENAAAYRPDWKGVVERYFGLTHAVFGPYTPGFVEPDFRERGAEDYRKNAVLTLDDLTKIIIHCVRILNHRVRETYEGDAEIIAANVPFAPVELWKWGKENLRCDGRRFDLEYAKLHLLPHADVTVTRRGVSFMKGLYYSCPSLIKQPWYLKAQQQKLKLKASYHPGDISTILVIDPDDRTQSYACALAPHSQRFSGKSLVEVDALRQRGRDTNYVYQASTGTEYSFSGHDQISQVIEFAKQRKAAEHDPRLSHRERVANMRDNRAREKAYEQTEQARHFGLGPDETSPAPDQGAASRDDAASDEAFLARQRKRQQAGV